jgi:hypothetical protein
MIWFYIVFLFSLGLLNGETVNKRCWSQSITCKLKNQNIKQTFNILDITLSLFSFGLFKYEAKDKDRMLAN